MPGGIKNQGYGTDSITGRLILLFANGGLSPPRTNYLQDILAGGKERKKKKWEKEKKKEKEEMKKKKASQSPAEKSRKEQGKQSSSMR